MLLNNNTTTIDRYEFSFVLRIRNLSPKLIKIFSLSKK